MASKILSSIRKVKAILLGTLIAGLVTITPAQAQVPPSYQDLYSYLDGKLNTFLSSIGSQWNGSKSPVLYSGGLTTANGNAGAALLTPTRRAGVQLELDRLYNLGARAVTVNASFPLFYEPFFVFNGTPAQYSQLIDFYKFVASEVRRRGMYLVVETGVLFPGFYSTGSGFNLSGYYATLNASTYASGRAATAANIARELQPDFLSVGAEPENEAALTGVTAIASPQAWATVVRTIVTEVRNAGSLVPIGSGIGTWSSRGTEYIDAMAGAGIDYVDLHVYPINGNILDATLAFANQAMSKGLRVGMTEAWLLKQRDSEFTNIDVATDPQIFARDAFSFWAPLDQKFLDAMTRLAQYKQFVFLSPFWSKYFWAYLDYNNVGQMPAEQISELSNVAAAQAIVSGSVTDTGTAYGRMNKPPNTTNPVNVLSAASFSSAALGSNVHASAFGVNLASSTAQATTLPLPTELGGVTVTVTDILGVERAAFLVFVSPGQVNFLMPAGMAPGFARVAIRNSAGTAEAQVMIRNVAPSVFSANYRGSGLAAAISTIIRTDGARTDSFVATCGTDGSCSPIPVDLAGETDRVFLSLYGTGIRGVSSVSNVRVTIGGVAITPIFAGPQPQYAGLDQVNVELPKTLRGRGTVNVELRVDNALANIVTVQIR